MAYENQNKEAVDGQETAPAISENSDSLEIWRSRVNRAKKCRKDWETEYKVETLEKFFLGKQNQGNQRQLNHFFATIKTQQPNLFYTNPRFFVRPNPGQEDKTDESAAAIGEGLLHAIAEQDFNLAKAGKLAVLQAFFRIGVLKSCYDPKLQPNPNAGEPMYATDAANQPILDEGGGSQPLNNPTTGEAMTEPPFVMSDECYSWEWIDANNMLLPADGGPFMKKWTWIGEEIVVTMAEAENDQRFPADIRARLKSNETVDKKNPDSKSDKKDDKDAERLRYFECYDLVQNKLVIFADGQDFEEFLVNGPLPDGIEDHPYAILPGWTPIIAPEPSPWPFPHVYNWMDIQENYNKDRHLVSEGAKRSARKGVYWSDSFENSEEAVKMLQNPDDMVFALGNNRDSIPKIIESPDVNPSIYKSVEADMFDWRTIAGVSGARSLNPDSNTATEAAIVDRSENLRDSDMQGDVNMWLSTAGKKMLQLVKKTLTLEKWIKLRSYNDQEFKEYMQRIYGVNPIIANLFPGLKEAFMERFGQEKPFRLTRENLIFEADVSVIPGSARPQNLSAERKDWLEFLGVIGQAPQLALSREVLKYTASKFDYIPERMVDELNLLAQTMIQVSANQAGRSQGAAGKSPSPNGTTASPDILSGANVQ